MKISLEQCQNYAKLFVAITDTRQEYAMTVSTQAKYAMCVC